MPQKCVVPNCSHSYKEGTTTLVSFPQDTHLKEKWLSALGMTGYALKRHQRICEFHFKATDWVDFFSKKKILKSKTVPSLVCLKEHCISECEVSRPAEGVVLLKPSKHMNHNQSCAIAIAEDFKDFRATTPHTSSQVKNTILKCDKLNIDNAVLRNNISQLVSEINATEKEVVLQEKRILALSQAFPPS